MGGNRRDEMNRYLFGNGKPKIPESKKRNPQRHTHNFATYSQRKSPRDDIVNIDLHDLALHQAKNRIKEVCKDASQSQTILFCHGFNRGTEIRDFIRGGQLERSLRDSGMAIEIWAKDEGNTYVNRV